MEVQIARDGVVISRFQLDELGAAIASGQISPDDYGWHEGLPEWKPLREICHEPPQGVVSTERRQKTKRSSAESTVQKVPTGKSNWREDAATEKQIEYLKSFGVVASQGMTKGEASDLIEKYQNDPKTIQAQSDKRFAQWELSMEQARNKRAEQGAYAFRVDVEKATREVVTLKQSKAVHEVTIRSAKKKRDALQRKLDAATDEKRESLESQISDLDEEISDIELESDYDPSYLEDAKEEQKQFELVRVKFWKATFNDDWILSEDVLEYEDLLDAADTINRLFDEYGQCFKAPTNKQIADILKALDAVSPDWDMVKPESFYATLDASFPEQIRTAPKKGASAKKTRSNNSKPRAKGCLVLLALSAIGASVMICSVSCLFTWLTFG